MEDSGCSLQFSSPGQAVGSQTPQKNVSIAPSTSLLSDRQYKVRRPLFTQHTSILKKTPGHSTEQTQSYVGPKAPAQTEMEPGPSLQTRLNEGQLHSHIEHFPTGDRSRISPFRSSRPPSSVLQVHRLSTPVRPQLRSPVLHPRYSPGSALRRPHTNLELDTSSLYQAEYWACAIPKDPPPTLSGQDLQQDYEALLDYTYPLRSEPQAGDWTLQDSGIEMDILSSGLSDLNMSLGGVEHSKDFVSGSDSLALKGTPFSLTEPVLTVDQPKWSKNTTVSSFSAALITLPWDRGIEEDEDEEFRSLPRQLEQLQQLSQQVREVAARLQPVHCEPPLSRSPPVGQDTEDTVDGQHRTDDFHLLWTEDSVDPLRGLEQHSLMEHVSVFCGHLEKLVRWLYAASQKIEQLAPPTKDIHSVKSSLAQYQNFQRDVNSHMPLTSSVLQTGRLLLRCIHSTSPVLRDTLLLIESQSRLLESHTEHFFSSILSAMDSLTQPQTEGSRPQTNAEKEEATSTS